VRTCALVRSRAVTLTARMSKIRRWRISGCELARSERTHKLRASRDFDVGIGKLVARWRWWRALVAGGEGGGWWRAEFLRDRAVGLWPRWLALQAGGRRWPMLAGREDVAGALLKGGHFWGSASLGWPRGVRGFIRYYCGVVAPFLCNLNAFLPRRTLGARRGWSGEFVLTDALRHGGEA
jgi:hypothetical protein